MDKDTNTELLKNALNAIEQNGIYKYHKSTTQNAKTQHENAQNALCPTPGEWFPLKQGTEIQSSEGMHEIAAYAGDGEVFTTLAIMHEGGSSDDSSGEVLHYEVSHDEAYANACMMAAAKKMYAALEWATTFAQGSKDQDNSLDNPAFNGHLAECHEAMKEARGEK